MGDIVAPRIAKHEEKVDGHYEKQGRLRGGISTRRCPAGRRAQIVRRLRFICCSRRTGTIITAAMVTTIVMTATVTCEP
jgi:hypothetical protein